MTFRSRLVARLSREAGFTVIETVVAAAVLIVGLLGTFALLDTAQVAGGKARAREGATNLAREILEDARDTPFSQVDLVASRRDALQALDGRTGTVTTGTSSVSTQVQRRGVSYTVSVRWCSVDDGRDGYGAHGTDVTWCSDATSVGTADTRPQDLKRVTIQTSWSIAGTSGSTVSTQTATFSSGGVAVAPPVPSIQISSPTGLSATAPVITSNPASGNVTFKGSSVGAADMRFLVDGVERATGVTNNNNGTWSFDWNILGLSDGVYTIGTIAIDALGTRSSPAVVQVRLARGAATPVTNVTGGYNDVFKAGVKTQVVELGWDASADGSVTGYEVLKGSTTVCAASLATSCMDLTPAASGSTVYTINTLYTNAAGTQSSVSTTYTVTAPTTATTTTPLPTTYAFVTGTTSGTTGCNAGGYAGNKDLVPTMPATGTSLSTTNLVVGCIGPLPAGTTLTAGTNAATFSGWWSAGNGNKVCTTSYYLYLNGSTLIAGSGVNGGAGTLSISANTSSRKTVQFNTAARTFAAGDRLSFIVFGGATNTVCSGMGVAFHYGAPLASGQSASTYGTGTNLGQSILTLPLNGSTTTTGGSTLAKPGAPTGLTPGTSTDGTTLTWTAPTGTPAVEFYRIYRDGQNYTDRYDTAGANTSTVTWTDTATGGATHTYRVTAVSSTMAESAFAGPVTG